KYRRAARPPLQNPRLRAGFEEASQHGEVGKAEGGVREAGFQPAAAVHLDRETRGVQQAVARPISGTRGQLEFEAEKVAFVRFGRGGGVEEGPAPADADETQPPPPGTGGEQFQHGGVTRRPAHRRAPAPTFGRGGQRDVSVNNSTPREAALK